ncbi:uncharacterized protein [Haliotis cracherodii]|uniref:uncharacterized protein n=1 Tax=Haliotis cracherodii TaxID=6455 RepID=UPI0039EBFF48
MADVSLDDYIQKKNFRVQIQNDWNQGGNANLTTRGGNAGFTTRGGKAGFTTRGGKAGFTTRGGKAGFTTRGGKAGFTTRGGKAGFTTRKNQNSPGGVNRIQPNQNRGPSVMVTGLGNVKSFDARQKIGQKVQFDARDRLQMKKPVDARMKISGPRGQVGANTINIQGGIRQRITGPGDGTRQTISAPGVRQQVVGPGSGIRQQVSRLSSGMGQQLTRPGSGITEERTLTVKLGELGNDARKKIIALKTNKGTYDARSRIAISPPNQQQQVTITGIGKVSQGAEGTFMRTANSAGSHQIQKTGLITRTLNNTPSQSSESGIASRIQLTNGGLQVTRAIPSATVSFEGSMLTVTKRTQQYQQEEEPPQSETQDNQYSQYNEMDSFEDENDLNLGSYSEEIKPQLLQIKKTIRTTPFPVESAPKSVPAMSTLKRKAPQPAKVQSSGPLKFVKPPGGPHIPIIVPPKKAKMTAPVAKPVVKQTKVQVKEPVEEEEETTQDILSPLQGYRVYVTNLHPVVNQDDIIELFGAIGALRKAKLIKQGTAEVVYVKKDDSLKAVQKYHNRELDGLPMQVKLLTSTTATVKVPAPAPVEADDNADASKQGPLKLLKQASSASSILRAQAEAESAVEPSLVHRALFKLGAQGSKPVTFTVKI